MPSLKVQTLAGDLPVLRSDREPAIKIGNDVESKVRFGTNHKGSPHQGEGGWLKSRHSKGGCVDLVL